MGDTILIVDDEVEIIELLQLYLENEGFETLTAADGNEALEIFAENSVDLAILDIMMPELNGYELVKKIRKKSSIPLIFLSAKSAQSDKILGLGLGADDYITKPFSPLEVVARVKAQLRKYHSIRSELEKSLYDETNTGETNIQDINMHKEEIQQGELILDISACKLFRRGQEIELTSLEYKILKFFMESPDRVYTKKQIYEHVWEEPYYGNDNTLMVHISRLREKIEEDPAHPVYLKTIRGIGYRFEGVKR